MPATFPSRYIEADKFDLRLGRSEICNERDSRPSPPGQRQSRANPRTLG
jgi:hypothetical protein